MMRYIVVLVALLAGSVSAVPIPPAAAARPTPPGNTGPCPYPLHGVVGTCFSPADMARAEAYMRPKPIDPSTLVDTATSLPLRSLVIVWCSTIPVEKPPPCNVKRTHSIMYAYGDGYQATPQQDAPPFVWITESRDLKANVPTVHIERGISPATTCVRNACTTGLDISAWYMTVSIPSRHLSITLGSDEGYDALQQIVVALLTMDSSFASPSPGGKRKARRVMVLPA